MFHLVLFKRNLPATKDPNVGKHDMEWNEGRVRQKPGVKTP
jgi:hypothetical protein